MALSVVSDQQSANTLFLNVFFAENRTLMADSAKLNRKLIDFKECLFL